MPQRAGLRRAQRCPGAPPAGCRSASSSRSTCGTRRPRWELGSCGASRRTSSSPRLLISTGPSAPCHRRRDLADRPADVTRIGRPSRMSSSGPGRSSTKDRMLIGGDREQRRARPSGQHGVHLQPDVADHGGAPVGRAAPLVGVHGLPQPPVAPSVRAEDALRAISQPRRRADGTLRVWTGIAVGMQGRDGGVGHVETVEVDREAVVGERDVDDADPQAPGPHAQPELDRVRVPRELGRLDERLALEHAARDQEQHLVDAVDDGRRGAGLAEQEHPVAEPPEEAPVRRRRRRRPGARCPRRRPARPAASSSAASECR